MKCPVNHLVIMAKQPIAGRVKSRLARDIGVACATGVYRTLMTTTLRNLSRDGRWKTWAAVAPDRTVHDYIWPTDISTFPQGRGDLGTRMQAIFDRIPVGPVIIIGTDIPFITSTDIANAFTQIGPKDVVFGNAGDGGYWLVGARRSPRVPDIFENVRWSSEHALTDTIRNCNGLKIGFAAERFDVDTRADYLKWRRSCAGH